MLCHRNRGVRYRGVAFSGTYIVEQRIGSGVCCRGLQETQHGAFRSYVFGHGGEHGISILALSLRFALLLFAVIFPSQEVHALRRISTWQEIIKEIGAMCAAGAEKS